MHFKLPPKEEQRLRRFLEGIDKLGRAPVLSQWHRKVMKLQMKTVLVILGAKCPDNKMVEAGLNIVQDVWPFKRRRLLKLIYGRK